MTRRLRVILPPTWALLTVALLYAALEGFMLLLEWQGGTTFEDLRARPAHVIIGTATVSLGFFRVLAFHPFFRFRYREWLARTPWTSRSPLPDGPVSLIWEDIILLSVLAGLVLHAAQFSPPRMLTTFLVSYLGILLVTLMTTGASAYGYAIAFGFGLIARLWQAPWEALGVALALYGVGQLGLRHSLAKFPWTPEANWFLESFRKSAGLSGRTEMRCGWPYDQCPPKVGRQVKVPITDAIVLCLLAGWWFFVLLSTASDPVDRALAAKQAPVFLSAGMAGIRVLIYLSCALPPISLVGRLAQFRWIIPGYDQIFIAPATACAVPFIIAPGLRRAGVSDELIGSLAIALALFIVLKAGPRFEAWRLTGRLRTLRWSDALMVRVD